VGVTAPNSFCTKLHAALLRPGAAIISCPAEEPRVLRWLEKLASGKHNGG
jgi:hypothetical protein